MKVLFTCSSPKVQKCPGPFVCPGLLSCFLESKTESHEQYNLKWIFSTVTQGESSKRTFKGWVLERKEVGNRLTHGSPWVLDGGSLSFPTGR